MTVSNTPRRAGPFPGNGVTTAFPFAFKVFAASDVQVVLQDAAGAETTLTSQYTIALNADQDNNPGGTITYPVSGALLPVGSTLTAVGDLPAKQGTDLTNLGRFLPQVQEDALDYLTILAQQLLERADRSLTVAVSDSDAPQALPAALLRAGKFLAFDVAGQPVVTAGMGSDGALRADLALGTGAGLVGFKQAGVGAVVRSLLARVLGMPVDVKDYGAVGDGVTDDTVAIQAAMTATLSINGGHLHFPAGTYKITAALTIGLWTGWQITGNSRGDTFIRQATNNTPVFKFTKENAHSWHVSDLTCDWSNQQVAANTAAAGFYFDFDTHANAGAYNWSAERISFAKGNRGFAVNSAATNVAWGCSIDDIVYASTMTGSVVDFSPTPTAGQPNVRIGKIYCRADSIPAGVPVINLQACEAFSIDHLEVNNALLGAELLSLGAGAYGRVGAMRVEVGTYTTNLAALIRASDAFVDIGQFYADSLTINPGGGNKVYAIKIGGVNADVKVSQLRIAQGGAPITSGTFYALAGGASGKTRMIIDRCSLDQAKLSDLAADPIATYTTVEDWVRPRIAPDRGDVSVALVAGTDETTQLFKTTLTANRTVALENVLTGNLFNAMQWTVVRNAAVPGAFTLDVGGVKTIPANTNARVTVAYRRQAWELIDYVVLP